MRSLLIGAFSLLMLAISVPLVAADLRGQVLRGNGTPAANVSIVLQGPTEKNMATNWNGYYRFQDIPSGTYTLTIEGQPEQVQVRVPPEGTERNFRVQ